MIGQVGLLTSSLANNIATHQTTPCCTTEEENLDCKCEEEEPNSDSEEGTEEAVSEEKYGEEEENESEDMRETADIVTEEDCLDDGHEDKDDQSDESVSE